MSLPTSAAAAVFFIFAIAPAISLLRVEASASVRPASSSTACT